MVFDLSIIVIGRDPNTRIRELVIKLNDLLNEKSIIHEFILVIPQNNKSNWSESCNLSKEYKNITAVRIDERIPLESSSLCGSSLTYSHYSFVLPNDHSLELHDIYACYVAISKSNIELLYAFQRSNRTIFKIPSFFYRQVLRVFSGLSAYRSETFIFKSEKAKHLRIKTPYFFLFDKLLQPWVDHSMYLELNGKKIQSNPKNSFFYLFVQFMANTYVLECIIIALLSLNIILLLKAKLLLSFVLACMAVALIWTNYLVKWRRRIAYKVLEKC